MLKEVKRLEVVEFFKRLAQHCEADKCEGCNAHLFCYTAPKSMTKELIDQTINKLCSCDDTHKSKEHHAH